MLIQEERGDGRTCHGMRQVLLDLLLMEFLEYVIVNREFRYIHVFWMNLREQYLILFLAGCGSDASSAQGSSSKSAESSNNDSYTVKMDGNLVEGSFGKEMTGEHKVDIYAYETE